MAVFSFLQPVGRWCLSLVAASLMQAAALAAAVCPPAVDMAAQRLDSFAAKRQLISTHVPEALMSAIAYLDTGTGGYTLPPGWQRGASFRDDTSGLFIASFINAGEARLTLAFRGTEPTTMADVENSLFGKTQLAPALAAVQRMQARYQGWLLTVTGHSLGGALALEMSHALDGVEAVAFNPSPRIGERRNAIPYYRVIFRERDEPLELVRGTPQDTADWGLRYNVRLDIVPGIVGYRPLTQHAIDTMVRGMLVIAAEQDATARDLLAALCNSRAAAR
jgi:dienelactone hydrolase